MSDRARLLRALLRQDLSCFVRKCLATLEPGTPYAHNWHIDHLCWQLTRVARGELTRLIINVPPRSMKSITVSVAFPAWVPGRSRMHPDARSRAGVGCEQRLLYRNKIGRSGS